LDNKIYIGYTSNFKKRFREHKHGLKNNVHRNDYLQKSWNKYGEENFKFEILEEYPNEGFILPSMEHYWVTTLNLLNRDFGYNLLPTNPYDRPALRESQKKALIESRVGKKHTEETKIKIKEGRKANPPILTEAGRQKIINTHLGRKLSDEAKKKIGDKHRGKKNPPRSEETKLKISNSSKGKKKNKESIDKTVKARRENGSYNHSPEARIKIGLAAKGRIPWNKGIFKNKKTE
jgi:group I intron endonuclease